MRHKFNYRFPSRLADGMSPVYYGDPGETLTQSLEGAYRYYNLGSFDTFCILSTGIVQTEYWVAEGSNLDRSLFYVGEVS